MPCVQELGCVLYQYNVLGTRGPRKMTAAIPQVDASGHRVNMSTGDREDVMLERWGAAGRVGEAAERAGKTAM